MLCYAPVRADDLAEISKSIRAGQFNEALGKADAALAQRPRDPQMRFLKGLILTEQNKSIEAILIFTKLTEDFPELPEPYNNLAVLYASAGQYDKARTALEAAIRTNPTYATAHENLGDVYAKLASQAYDKALQLDSSNTSAKSKLTMVRTMVSAGASQPLPPNAKTASVAVTSAKLAPTPTPTPTPPPDPGGGGGGQRQGCTGPSGGRQTGTQASGQAGTGASGESQAGAKGRAEAGAEGGYRTRRGIESTEHMGQSLEFKGCEVLFE
jgi:tetratricopeptide (TPR) repeat protein